MKIIRETCDEIHTRFSVTNRFFFNSKGQPNRNNVLKKIGFFATIKF